MIVTKRPTGYYFSIKYRYGNLVCDIGIMSDVGILCASYKSAKPKLSSNATKKKGLRGKRKSSSNALIGCALAP
jgi:hypothetical protein